MTKSKTKPVRRIKEQKRAAAAFDTPSAQWEGIRKTRILRWVGDLFAGKLNPMIDRENQLRAEIDALRLALAASRDEAEKAKGEVDEPVKGPRAQYEISDHQIKRMSDDWDEARNYESCMAGPASAFGFGWRMSASRSPSSDAWNDLVAKLDSLKAFVQTIAQEKGEYGRYGYNQPTQRALEAQALLAAIDAARADAARKEQP